WRLPRGMTRALLRTSRVWRFHASRPRTPGARATRWQATRVGGGHVGAPREESLIVPDPFTDDNAVRADLEQAQVLAVGTRPDFYNRHYTLQLAVELEIALQDNRVGQKRRPVRTEPEIRVAVFQFGRQHHCDAHPGQGRNQAVQRFAEILAKGGGERELESGQRINDDALGLKSMNRLSQLVLRLVDREIQGARVNDAH